MYSVCRNGLDFGELFGRLKNEAEMTEDFFQCAVGDSISAFVGMIKDIDQIED